MKPINATELAAILTVSKPTALKRMVTAGGTQLPDGTWELAAEGLCVMLMKEQLRINKLWENAAAHYDMLPSDLKVTALSQIFAIEDNQ